MKKTTPFIAALLLMGINSADASNVGVDFNVHVGSPPPPQVIIRETAPPPTRVIVREPEPYRDIIIEEDVDFIYPNELGFYVGVGIPFDLFFLNNFYFTYRDGGWYRSHNHRGPWVHVDRRHLPYGIRKHKLDRIRHYRDREYRIFERDRDHYRGGYGRSVRGDWKEHRKAEKRYIKSERKMEKAQRKDDKRWDKDDRRGGRGSDRDHDRGRGGRD